MIRPPSARVGPVTPEERKAVMAKSPVKGKYDQTVDPESAYEMLQKRVQRDRLDLAAGRRAAQPTAGARAGVRRAAASWRGIGGVARRHLRHQPAARHSGCRPAR